VVALAELLGTIEGGSLGDPLPLLAYIAGRELELPAEELGAALRRALLVRASGGDPRREVDVDDPGTRLLARDLHSPERSAALGIALERLVPLVRELAHVREAVLFLVADLDLAWRLFMLALLAEELGEAQLPA